MLGVSKPTPRLQFPRRLIIESYTGLRPLIAKGYKGKISKGDTGCELRTGFPPWSQTGHTWGTSGDHACEMSSTKEAREIQHQGSFLGARPIGTLA